MIVLTVWMLLGSLMLPESRCLAEPAFFSQTQQTTILNAPVGAALDVGELPPPVTPATLQPQVVQANVTLSVFGAALKALMVLLQPDNTIEGVTYTEVFSFGKRVFSEETQMHSSGILGFAAGITPTEVRVPLASVVVGPLMVRLDGGARFTAEVLNQNTPSILFPDTLSSLSVQLSAKAFGAAYAEGYLQFLFARGGVGGQVDLIDTDAIVTGNLMFDGNRPTFHVSVLADFLKGRIYSFLYVFTFFPFRWKRLWDHDYYRWRGLCVAAGTAACPAN